MRGCTAALRTLGAHGFRSAGRRARAVPFSVSPFRRLTDSSAHDFTLIYESDHSYKFRFTSGIGAIYSTCWLAYCGAEVFYVDPTGAIASNVPLVGFIGAASMGLGGYLLRTFSSRTVGRLELLRTNDSSERLRITTYDAIGSERRRETKLSDVVGLTPPNDPSHLRTFSLISEDDKTRPYLVLVGPGDVRDEEAFHRVMYGIKPHRHKLRRRRRKR